MSEGSAESAATQEDPNDEAIRELVRRRTLVQGAFSPATPVTNRELFAGRIDQLARLVDVAGAPGRHAIVYGERGVGKTSLARVGSQILGVRSVTLYYTCSSQESFGGIWRGIFGELRLTSPRPRLGFTESELGPVAVSALELLQAANGSLGPNDVRAALQIVSNMAPLVVVIDEFDRLADERTRAQFADTIKVLADHNLPVTIVLVGVGGNVTDLVRSHESVNRHLTQIPMPRMASDEVRQIVERGMVAAELTADSQFTERVVQLAQGVPYYAHLISQHAAMRAVDDGRDEVVVSDFDAGVAAALNDVSEIVRDAYYRATVSNHETIYAPVLLACATTSKDELETFSPSDVRERLQAITGRQGLTNSHFAPHLRDFSSDGPRGSILVRTGSGRPRYKFVDPLLPPYVIMRGVVDGASSVT